MPLARVLEERRVLEEIARLAFADVRTLFDQFGNLKPLQELTDDEAAIIASIRVVRRRRRSTPAISVPVVTDDPTD